MSISLTQILLAVVMVGATVALAFTYRKYLAANSKRRMWAMIESLGLDPDIASIGGIEIIMAEVRQRCGSCTSEDVCERWLAGDVPGDNNFCPNAKVFGVFKKYRGDAG